MKAEDRIEVAYARRAPVEEVDIRGLRDEALQAITLLRGFPSVNYKLPVATWMRLVGEWEKKRMVYLEGGDEGRDP